MPHSACAAVNENALAARKLALVEQTLPGGQTGERNCGGLDEADVFRLGGELAGLDHDVFCVSSTIRSQQRVDFFARLAGHAGPAKLDDSGNVPAQLDRQVFLLHHRKVSRPYLVVDGIDAGGENADERFAGSGLRAFEFVDAKRFGAAKSMDANRFHRKSSMPAIRGWIGEPFDASLVPPATASGVRHG